MDVADQVAESERFLLGLLNTSLSALRSSSDPICRETYTAVVRKVRRAGAMADLAKLDADLIP